MTGTWAPLEERLWRRVATGRPDECWPWQGARTPSGHGLIAGSPPERKSLHAHRVAWVLTNGPIPDGYVVRHTCDNAGCCNPGHLVPAARSDGDHDRRRLRRFYREDSATGCWVWTATLHNKGYGKFSFGGKPRPAHRVAYELLIGPVPDGLVLDHLCRNRRCVNPAHLEPVTHRVNILRGISPYARKARQTHCHRGHPFDEANTQIRPNGTRNCKACARDRKSQRRAA